MYRKKGYCYEFEHNDHWYHIECDFSIDREGFIDIDYIGACRDNIPMDIDYSETGLMDKIHSELDKHLMECDYL